MTRSFILKRAHRRTIANLHRAHGVNPECTRWEKTPIRMCVSESVCECETGFPANLVLLLRVLSPRQPRSRAESAGKKTAARGGKKKMRSEEIFSVPFLMRRLRRPPNVRR